MEVGPVVQDIILRNCFNLLPFHYRRNNIQPPHSSFIRFTWTQGDQKRVEHYSYNMKLFLHNSPTAEEFYGFIQIWIATKREIGSSCSFELNDEEMGDSVLNLVRARNETTEQTERSVTIIKEDRKQYEIIVKEKETQTSERFKWFFEVSFMGVS
ncbi:hypothetical protein B9Z55_007045 [Caenorhabditis nigoni]|nr:hypothetical protein B9Z55_007045 [Caenorhabditis nigoni]